jgi:hypothetical protein
VDDVLVFLNLLCCGIVQGTYVAERTGHGAAPAAEAVRIQASCEIFTAPPIRFFS